MLRPPRPTVIALASAGLALLAFVVWYQGEPPLTPSEIDRAITALETQPPQSLGSFDVPAFRRFLEADDGEPFYNVNLFEFRERARYADGDRGRSGREAFRRYGDFMTRRLPVLASHLVFASDGVGVPEWDLVAVVRYRSRRDFAALVTSPEFAEAVVDKWAALESNVRVPVQSPGFFTNAYWLVGALLAVGVLVVNVAERLYERWRARRANGSTASSAAAFHVLVLAASTASALGCSDDGMRQDSGAGPSSRLSDSASLRRR